MVEDGTGGAPAGQPAGAPPEAAPPAPQIPQPPPPPPPTSPARPVAKPAAPPFPSQPKQPSQPPPAPVRGPVVSPPIQPPPAPQPRILDPTEVPQAGPRPTKVAGPEATRTSVERQLSETVADLEDIIQNPKSTWKERQDRKNLRNLEQQGASQEQLSRVKELQDTARGVEKSDQKQSGMGELGRQALDLAAHLSATTGQMGKFVTAIRQILNTIAVFEALYRALRKLAPPEERPREPRIPQERPIAPPQPVSTPAPSPVTTPAPAKGPDDIVPAEIVPRKPVPVTPPSSDVPGPQPVTTPPPAATPTPSPALSKSAIPGPQPTWPIEGPGATLENSGPNSNRAWSGGIEPPQGPLPDAATYRPVRRNVKDQVQATLGPAPKPEFPSIPEPPRPLNPRWNIPLHERLRGPKRKRRISGPARKEWYDTWRSLRKLPKQTETEEPPPQPLEVRGPPAEPVPPGPMAPWHPPLGEHRPTPRQSQDDIVPAEIVSRPTAGPPPVQTEAPPPPLPPRADLPTAQPAGPKPTPVDEIVPAEIVPPRRIESPPPTPTPSGPEPEPGPPATVPPLQPVPQPPQGPPPVQTSGPVWPQPAFTREMADEQRKREQQQKWAAEDRERGRQPQPQPPQGPPPVQASGPILPPRSDMPTATPIKPPVDPMAAWRPPPAVPVQSAAKVAATGPMAQAAAQAGTGVLTTAAAQGPAAAASSALPALGKLAAAAGPVGIAFTAVAGAATAAVVGFKMFTGMIKEQAQKLEGYSAAVAGAVAQSEIRQELATFRRAQRIGPDVAKWELLRGKMDEKLTDIGTEILKQIMEWANKWGPQIESALGLLGLVPPAIEMQGNILQAIYEALTFDIGGAMTDFQEASEGFKKLKKAIEDYIKDKKDDDLNDWAWGQFDQILQTRQAWDRQHNVAPQRRPLAPNGFALPNAQNAAMAGAAGGGP